MKDKLFKTIKGRMIIFNALSLIVLMITIFSLFVFFADKYYYSRKIEWMKQNFNQLKERDIQYINDDEWYVIELEERRTRIVVIDENNKCLYASRAVIEEGVKNVLVENLIKKKNQYTGEAQSDNTEDRTECFGKIEKNGVSYYIYMYEKKFDTRVQFGYYKLFLGGICVITVIVGILVTYLISSKISKPIKKIERAANDAVENNFEININEKQKFVELSDLAVSINIMMSQIRKQMKELEQELQHKETVLERRRTFVNNVSHELKTPLAVLSSQAEMLSLVKDDEEKRAYYCRSIMDETKKMSELINGIMVSYSSQNDEEKFEVEEADVRECVETVCLNHKAIFESEGIQLYVTYDEDCRALINKRYFEQAISNYVTNSIKHSPEHGNVYIRVINLQNTIRIEVEDRGTGIALEDKDKIWDMFYKGDMEKNLQGQKGSGLGLYIVKSIVKMHGGSCGYENLEPGVVFWLEVPKQN